MKNRFNRLTSKEWLPFQKSWFKYSNDEKLYRENLRFFCKAENTGEHVLYFGDQFELFSQIAKENTIDVSLIENFKGTSQFIFFDLRNYFKESTKLKDYENLKKNILNNINDQKDNLIERRFVCILMPNLQVENIYYPFAWDLAKEVGKLISLKDEKIACITENGELKNEKYFQPSVNYFYCLYFRKDEHSGLDFSTDKFDFFSKNQQFKRKTKFSKSIPGWFILKPQQRKKEVILHPAKYPEELVEMFVSVFTNENDNVFDPIVFLIAPVALIPVPVINIASGMT